MLQTAAEKQTIRIIRKTIRMTNSGLSVRAWCASATSCTCVCQVCVQPMPACAFPGPNVSAAVCAAVVLRRIRRELRFCIWGCRCLCGCIWDCLCFPVSLWSCETGCVCLSVCLSLSDYLYLGVCVWYVGLIALVSVCASVWMVVPAWVRTWVDHFYIYVTSCCDCVSMSVCMRQCARTRHCHQPHKPHQANTDA